MPVEIDETEYTNLRNIAGTMQKMLANPKTRSKVLEAQKIINPDAIIPEIDSTKPVFEKIDAVSEQVGKLAQQLADEKQAAKEEKQRAALEASWEKSRQKAVKAGYTSEGVEALEKYMIEKGVVDHEVAMPSFERLHPPETLVTHSADRFDAFTGLMPTDDKDDTKLLLEGNETGFMNKRIKDTLAAVRGR
jgi:hypothetical protein